MTCRRTPLTNLPISALHITSDCKSQNVVQAKHKGILGFEGTTIKHVPRGSSVLWVHVGFIYVCTGCVAFYLRR
jgi:hypothetical protein